MKKNILLLLASAMMLTCAFDAVYEAPESFPEQSDEVLIAPGAESIPEGEAAMGEQPEAEAPVVEMPTPEPAYSEPGNAEPVYTEPEVVEPIAEEPPAPVWQGIAEDQVALLRSLYDAMTYTGQVYSGWFTGENNAPCTWPGITCENGMVTGLKFERAGYFTVFPEEILAFSELKELHMIDTLVRGPLPESFFEDLPKLEVVELEGNFLTGEIPPLPQAFAVYPMLREITISDNLDNDERKAQLLYGAEYSDVAYFQPDPFVYPDTDLTPGLDGTLPEEWSNLPLLAEIDLSGNQLSGNVPDSWGILPLTELDLSDNGEGFGISRELYDLFVSMGDPEITLEGIIPPVVEEPTEVPTEIPAEEPVLEIPTEEPVIEPQPTEQIDLPRSEFPEEVLPTEAPVYGGPEEPSQIQPILPTAEPAELPGGYEQQPTEVPYVPTVDYPTQVPNNQPAEIPTQVPYVAPTAVPTQKPIIIVVTATPEPRFYTSTPAPRYYTATPQTYYYPQQYFYPTATPQTYYYPQYYYPTATPYTYYNPNWAYPTATPYTYYNPNWVYPTATSAYSYPQYVQNQQPTAAPTQDPASLLGFTYVLEAVSDNNIPMTWRYTGMSEYSINYLDASGNLYPAFAMEWTPAGQVCSASTCNATVSVPDELLRGGKFSLQLRVRDASGQIYISDPVDMEVASAEPIPTPTPEPQRSFFSDFFHWLFGPIIRLFGGK